MNKKTNGYKNIITVLLALLILGVAAGPASATKPGLLIAKYISNTELKMYFNITLGIADTVDETKITLTNDAGTPIAVINNSAVVVGSTLTITTASVGGSTAFKIDAAGEGLDLAAGAVADSVVPTDKNLESLNNSVEDGQSPTVALTYSANPAKAGAMTITATYSEAIAGTPAISINQPGTADITTQDMADSGNQTVWTYAYTVNTTTGGTYLDGTATVSLSTVADAATNNAAAPTGTNFTIDTTAPTVALTYSANPAKAGAMTITATYSEAIVGTPAISINQPGTADITTQDMADSGNQTVWTYAYTVNTTTGGTFIDGNATVSLSTVADAAANNAGSPTGTNFTIDTTAPTVALTYSANPAKAGAMTITATYPEAIVGTPAISINQPGTTDITTQNMTDSGNQTVWTYAYTVNTTTGGTYLDGTATVSLSTVADAAANNASSPTGTTFAIDTTAPTVALAYSANPAKAEAMTITATYSEAIVGTPAISIDQPGSTDITTQDMADSGNQTVWTYAYTVNTATSGTYLDGNVTVSLSTVADGAANNAGAPSGTNFTIDTTAPTVVLAYSANPAKAGAMTITAIYSEAIVGTPKISINQPGTTDITTQNMTDSGNQTVWTYAYTVNTTTGGTYLDGTSTVSLSAVADAAANNADTPTGTTFAIDTTAPAVALTYSANPAKAGAMTITATYSEAIVGTPAINIDQPGTTDITAQAMSGGATVWTYSYTVNSATGGTYIDGTATVSLSAVADAATNNAGAPTGTTFTIDTTVPAEPPVDTTAPTVALTYSANPAKAGAMTITATYSEAIVGTPGISIDQPGTTDITSQAMSGGATVWTYAYTVNTANGGAYVDGASTVSLSTVADAAANNANAPTGTTFIIDTTAPNFTAVRTAPNTIVLTFPENVDVTTTAGQGYTLSSGTVTANTDPAGSGNTITLTTSGVSVSPTVIYGAAAGTTVDTAANEVADGFSAVASSGPAASIVVTANNSAPHVNGAVTINATVRDSSGITSGSLGAGTISFLANGTEFASTILSSGVASTTYTRATAGAVTITAFYNSTLRNTTTVTFTPAVLPVLTVSATTATIITGMPTSVIFNVTSNGTAKANATVTLSGAATGSGITNNSGLAVISVNATRAGTITVTANLSGYNNGTINITTEEAATVYGNDTIGVYRNSTRTFFLRNSNDAGIGDLTIGYGIPGDTPVVGDWDYNGNDTIGVYRNSSNVFFLRNSNDAGIGDLTIGYGISGDTPVVGDWDGSGNDTIGVYRNSINVFFLRNRNDAGIGDLTIGYGISGDIPVVGDWDGDGNTTIGVYRPGTSMFFLRNSNNAGIGDLTIGYGISGDVPVVGDWDGDGDTTIGVYRPSTNTFFLRNSNDAGIGDLTIGYGISGDTPVIGDWDGI